MARVRIAGRHLPWWRLPGSRPGSGSVWAANLNDDSISEIDPATSTVEQTVPVGNGPVGVVVGGGFFYDQLRVC